MLLAILTAVAGLAVAAVPERPPAPTLTPVATESEAASTERRGEVYYHLMRARLALSQGRAGDVIREVGAATALMPDEPALLGESAMLLAIVGRRGDAERTARRALTLDDGQKTAMRVLADLSLAKAGGPRLPYFTHIVLHPAAGWGYTYGAVSIQRRFGVLRW